MTPRPHTVPIGKRTVTVYTTARPQEVEDLAATLAAELDSRIRDEKFPPDTLSNALGLALEYLLKCRELETKLRDTEEAVIEALEGLLDRLRRLPS